MGNTGTLKWQFGIDAFRLIGRELITDSITALFELVKNSYDANANEVSVEFVYIDDSDLPTSIIIKDDGHGMSLDDIQKKWMKIGSSGKKKEMYSPEPYRRVTVGEKGIGRFAVDKLGDRFSIKTKRLGDSHWIEVQVDWQEYENVEEDSVLFTDVENNYQLISADEQEYGTVITIECVRDKWKGVDIKRFAKQASRIVSPFKDKAYPFDVDIVSKAHDIQIRSSIESIKNLPATAQFHLKYDKTHQESVIYNTETHKFDIVKEPLHIFGGIEMTVFYFDGQARQAYAKSYGDDHNAIDGIKIYRDGIITTPFAEKEAQNDEKRDILGIDKRLWRDMFSRVSTREIIGYVNISKQGNPNIIDATNRQDFIDNEEYKALKTFIHTQLYSIEAFKVQSRNQTKKDISEDFNSADDELSKVLQSLKDISENNPAIGRELNLVSRSIRKLKSQVRKAKKLSDDEEKNYERKQSILLSLMSLQKYSIEVAHIMRTAMGNISKRTEFIEDFIDQEEYRDIIIQYSHEISVELDYLDKAIEQLLNYVTKSNNHTELNLSVFLSHILTSNSDIISRDIKLNIDVEDNIVILTNEPFFVEIMLNLVSNSIKALEGVADAEIMLEVRKNNSELVILFSDNGCGIPVAKREWVFAIFNTMTADQGGAGIGLYTVRNRVEALQGKVRIIDSKYNQRGVTFEIKIPIK